MKPTDYAEVECAVLYLEIEQGVARSDKTIALETKKMNIDFLDVPFFEVVQFFENVSQTIVERLESFAPDTPDRQLELLSELFFAGKSITRSEIGFMLECFGVAVHDKQLRNHKKKLDRYCKNYLRDLFLQTPGGRESAEDAAEIGYSLLIGVRTAAYFDPQLKLSRAQRLFHDELTDLAGISARPDQE